MRPHPIRGGVDMKSYSRVAFLIGALIAAAGCSGEDSSVGEARQELFYRGHYYWPSAIARTWQGADAECRANPGCYLVTVNDSSEENWLYQQQIAAGGGYWW